MLRSIFHTVANDFRRFQCCFNAISQFNCCAFSINGFNHTFNNCTLLVRRSEIAERVFLQLFYTEGDTVAFGINSKDNGFNQVTFTEFADSFFACFIPRNVRQVNQTVNTTW